ncbi:hypothetical protein [Peptoniphilus porci]|nr:hypothetical protein [Peptoniphilus porci]
MTNISWYFDHYGPYSSDVYNILHQDKDIKVQKRYLKLWNCKIFS